MADARRRMDQLLDAARRGSRTIVMGILNVTPDSFWDGGRFRSVEAAVSHLEQMAEDGADLVDIGGESTRPATFRSAARLPAEEEMERVLPVLRLAAARLPGFPISIDTYKASVARAAVEAGAVMINDISGFTADAGMPAAARDLDVPVCLMHLPGQPGAVERPAYGDVVAHVAAALGERLAAAELAGISPSRILLDPGLGFGKSTAENLELIRKLGELRALGAPLLVGPSRKSSVGEVLGGLPAEERVEGTAAAVALCIAGGASVVRVHDVKAMARVARVADAIVRGWPQPAPGSAYTQL